MADPTTVPRITAAMLPNGLFTPEAIALRNAAYAPASAGIGSVLGSALSPLSIALSLNNFFQSRADAREAENAARYNAALNTLTNAGIDPFAIYSPDVVTELLNTTEGIDTLSGLYPGDLRGELEAGTIDPYGISQQMSYGLISDAARNPSKYAQPFTGYANDVFDAAGDIWNDPSRILGVILGPGGVTGNVEWGGGVGDVPGRDPAIYTGTYGTVNTGVSTGNTVLDAAIRRVLGQQTGGETTTSDVILEGVAKVLGVPIDEVADILADKGVLTRPNTPSPGAGTTQTQTSQPTTSTVTPDQTGGTTIGVSNEPSLYDKILDWLHKNKDATDEQIRTTAENAKVTPEDIAGATGKSMDEVQQRWDAAGGNVLETSGGGLDTTGGGLDTTGGGSLDTRQDVIDTISGENVGTGGSTLDTTPTTVLDVPSGGGTGGGTPKPSASPAYDALIPQYRTVTTTPADLAQIDYLYDVGGESIFAPMRETQSEDDKRLARIRDLQRGSYAQGGPVDIVGLALQLLRG